MNFFEISGPERAASLASWRLAGLRERTREAVEGCAVQRKEVEPCMVPVFLLRDAFEMQTEKTNKRKETNINSGRPSMEYQPKQQG